MKIEMWGEIMNLSKSAENTLLVYANACNYHVKNYHFRSLQQTLDVKTKTYFISRSLSTINRENRKFRDEYFIIKWRRRTYPTDKGRQFTSSITHLTWKGVYYLVRRKLLPWSFVRTWERITKKVSGSDETVKEMREKRPEKIDSQVEAQRIFRISKIPLKILPYVVGSFP
ncbi:MAG: hypothetical protein FVQ85_21640 [Planctomycetes bacterium]|nr:hypothetical protein [Planctomycetota bacterium]